MKYCTNCSCAVDGLQCPICGRTGLRPIAPDDFCLLTEKEAMWSDLFTGILQDCGIPFTTLPAVGFGVSVKTGMPISNRIYVSYARIPEALELLRQTFPEDYVK